MDKNGKLLNFVNGVWQKSRAGEYLDVLNPATNKKFGTVPLSPGAEVDATVRAARSEPRWVSAFSTFLN